VTFKRIICFFCIMVVLEIGSMLSIAIWMHQDEGSSVQAESAHEDRDAVGEEKRAPNARDAAELNRNIERILRDDSARYAIYFLRPAEEEEPFLYQNRPMSPASMIKVFIMAAVMQEVHDGRLSLEEKLVIRESDVVGGAGVITWYNIGEVRSIRELVSGMIMSSDNTATNILIDRLGMDKINRYIQEHGYGDTQLVHKMMIGNGGRKNFSSVRDLGKLFSRLYYHQLVGESEDRFMELVLSGQKDKECFNAALPDFTIAHKTGEVTGLYDDGGIFYGKQGDFVLVIMNEGFTSRGDTIEDMKQLTRYFASTLKKKKK